MKKFSGFTDKEHLFYARTLSFALNIATRFYLETCRCYGKTSKVAMTADRLVGTINLLRSLLDNESFEYYPAAKHFKNVDGGKG